MRQITLSGCVTGDIASFGLAVSQVQDDQLFPLFDVVAPLDAPSWISTGRTINVKNHLETESFQAQVQNLREFASWK